jgi:hypothetical protein
MMKAAEWAEQWQATHARDRAGAGEWAARMVSTPDQGSYVLVTRNGFVQAKCRTAAELAQAMPESVRRELLAALEAPQEEAAA